MTAAGVLLAFAPAVVGVRTLTQRDTDVLYAPVRTLVVEELRAGRLPLWNPHEGAGKPLFAEGIHSVLHPVSLAGAVLAPSSIDFLILTYLVMAALGAFVLALALGASAPASAGAGLAFALSGFSVSMTGNLVFLAGLSTLPWVVAAARAAGAGARWGPVATALATGCGFLSGDVQSAVVGAALGAVLAADAGGTRGVARAFAGMGAGVLLAGVQLAATGALFAATFRNAMLFPGEETRWALAPGRLLEWLVPGLFRGPLDVLPERTSGERIDLEFAESVYLGVPLVVAAALGAFRGRRRTGVLLGAAVGVLLWLALGHHLGAGQLVGRVPVWNRFRYSEKMMAPLSLCAAGLGALGIDAFGADRLPRSWRRALTVSIVAAAALLLTLLLAPDATSELAARLLGDTGPFYRSTLMGGLPHLMVCVVALVAIDRVRHQTARASALALLVALAPAAAVYYGAHLGSPDARRVRANMRLETDSPAPRIAHAAGALMDPGEQRTYVDSRARIESTLLSNCFNVARGVDTLSTYGPSESRRLAVLRMLLGAAPVHHSRRFALTHVVVPTPNDQMNPELVGRDVEGGQLVQREEALRYELWAVPHRPWTFFPRRVFAIGPRDDAYSALNDVMTRGDDDTVVVEAPETPPTAAGRVLHVERGARSVIVEAESSAPALLVVQDAWWPGWRAAIDGRPTEILPADVLVRAVRWPQGRHRLEMTYDAPEIRFGLALSAVGAGLVLLLAVVAARRVMPA